ncbi:RDD family protein [Chitinophaga silvatica]|uniref:RDD family protein n=1 Tax=Chitinophaga silvatica TaxID=2282649 RepID=A0A3E1Y7J4_9BACT|nr:RDD family protein [Chitinophaga silvatica]RFS20993.1 RDD family protein [Chitinophaga silvatica]
MAEIKIPTSFNIDLEFESADLFKRFLAWLIDLLIRIAYYFIILFFLIASNIDHVTRDMVLLILAFLPVLFYFPIFEILMGGLTPGKKAMSLKVINMIGNPPSISQHLIRWIFRLVESPLLFFSIIPVAIPLISVLKSKYSQRLGDLIAGTIVINTKANGSIQDTVFRDVSLMGDYKPQFPAVIELSDKDINKVKDLLTQSLNTKDDLLANRVATRLKEVLKIDTELPDHYFLETILNDYNYYTTQ